MSIRGKIKRIIGPVLKPTAAWYFSKERPYRYRNLRITVLPGVFHPRLIISTKLLLRFVEELDLQGKSFLELGCGSGIISLLAASKGAQVSASDISKTAVKNTVANAEKNKLKLEVIESDLFENMRDRRYDFIIINPPYYPTDPKSEYDHAWHCGAEFEYFKKLFSNLLNHLAENGQVFMILSEDCDLDRIQEIASENALIFQKNREQKMMAERNFIFKILSAQSAT